ncbi:MAG TPA: cohesin domain-containing protein [Candidatus Paceibacterota bacterium]
MKYWLPIIFFFSTGNVLAAPPQLNFDLNTQRAAPDSQIVVKMMLGSQEPINALRLTWRYPAKILQPVIFNDSRSIVDIWQTRNWQETAGVIEIDGGLTRPFSGPNGEIAEITFNIKTEGRARLELVAAEIYLADGLGTRRLLSNQAAEIVISRQAEVVKPELKIDREPPQFEFTQTVQSPTESTYLVIFQVKDWSSGLRTTHLRSRQWLNWTEWSEVTNPARLPAGVWQYQIRAVDNQDNKKIETVYLGRELVLKLAGLVLTIIVFGFVILFKVKKWRQLKKF